MSLPSSVPAPFGEIRAALQPVERGVQGPLLDREGSSVVSSIQRAMVYPCRAPGGQGPQNEQIEGALGEVVHVDT